MWHAIHRRFSVLIVKSCSPLRRSVGSYDRRAGHDSWAIWVGGGRVTRDEPLRHVCGVLAGEGQAGVPARPPLAEERDRPSPKRTSTVFTPRGPPTFKLRTGLGGLVGPSAGSGRVSRREKREAARRPAEAARLRPALLLGRRMGPPKGIVGLVSQTDRRYGHVAASV